MSEAEQQEAPRLASIEGRTMRMTDGSALELPAGATVTPHGGGGDDPAVWDVETRGRAGRIAAGRTKEDCRAFADYLAKKEAR